MSITDNQSRKTFLPPADIYDFEDEAGNHKFREIWNKYIRGIMENLEESGDRFFNPLGKDAESKFQILGSRTIPWMTFPRISLVKRHRDDRQEAFRITEHADKYGDGKLKSEYCEWYEYRNEKGRLTSIVFNTEFPDYWEKLWDQSPERVVALYNELLHLPNGVKAQKKDLEDVDGNYDRYNDFNTSKGQIHMIQEINNIPAVGDLIKKVDQMKEVEVHDDNFAARNKPAYPTWMSADAKVCIDLRSLMRKGLYFSLQNPIGMYILGWNDDGWKFSNGNPVKEDSWKVIRGNRNGQILRLEFQIPEGEDLYIGGIKVVYGGQLAEHLTVGIKGLAATKKQTS